MAGLAEVEVFADIAGDSFLAQNFCGRYPGRNWWDFRHAQNEAKSRE